LAIAIAIDYSDLNAARAAPRRRHQRGATTAGMPRTVAAAGTAVRRASAMTGLDDGALCRPEAKILADENPIIGAASAPITAVVTNGQMNWTLLEHEIDELLILLDHHEIERRHERQTLRHFDELQG
jgi:hypothetical protein